MGECPATENNFVSAADNTSVFNTTSYPLPSDNTNEAVEKLKFITYGIISSIIIGLGILGNSINLAVLTRPNLKGVTFVYLTWLAISDLMSLVVSLSSMFRLHGMQPRSYIAAVYYAHVEMPLVNAFMASSVFLVVALTVDRYFSVCLPTRFKEVHNTQRAKRSIAAAYICAFALYIPVCFQKHPVEVQFANKTEYIACEYSKITSHTAFKVYLMIKEVIVRLGPVVLLAILNTTIIITFRKTIKKRRDLLSMSNTNSTGQQREGSSKRYREERRLVILLAGIVILFFIGMTPAAVLTILISDDREFHFGFQLFRAFANTLELSNYAMNFYVYCMCSSEIRRTFIALITCSKQTPNVSSASSKPSLESNNKY
ncbi:probable G-protein coupled receptor AH9.1 [Parasteatoda tepidariorum]|uniref:probable G-protein coupled receptor AH9.1 n=1 Tax=Parasteatoda tepidariorum TaxID=114398 RepID=UPI00077FA178|nr:probable G-protein coupled receptor AH9.1 [Parasteatoda tepidariorum]XP_042904627.1 probable G-protein coupled receptor AH9.1 [Parasteatoda tepidariorum]